MADLTLYLPSSGAPDHDVAFSGTWNSAPTTRYKAVTSKISSANSAKLLSEATATNPWLVAAVMFVSEAQAARSWTVNDKFSGVIRCVEQAADCDMTLYLIVRVFSADGATERGVLYSGEVNNTEFSTSNQARCFTDIAVQNAVTQQTNDHIVIEFGYKSVNTTATSKAGGVVVGDNSVTDLPLDNTTTSAYNPWIAFTYGAAAPSYSGSASLGGGGACAATGAKAGSGAASISAVGAIAALGVAAMSGLASLAGAGAIVATGQRVGSGAASIVAPAAIVESAGEKGGQSPGAVSGAGGITAEGIKAAMAAVDLAAGGGLESTGAKASSGAAEISGAGLVEASGTAEEVEHHSGSASLSGSGAIVASGSKGGQGQAAAAGGAGAFTAAGAKAGSGPAAPAGSGAIVSTGTKSASGEASLAGYGELEAAGIVAPSHSGTAAVSGAGGIEAYGVAGEWHTDAAHPKPAVRTAETAGKTRTACPKPTSRTVTQNRRRTWN